MRKWNRNDSRPDVVYISARELDLEDKLTSCPAIRKVTNWNRIFSTDKPCPVTGSRP
jgi:hypothetical protein